MYNRESGTPTPQSTLFSLGISSLFSLDDLSGEGYQSSGLRASGFLFAYSPGSFFLSLKHHMLSEKLNRVHRGNSPVS